MRKLIAVIGLGFVMILTCEVVLPQHITVQAYTEAEKQQAKAWLSAHGYPPTKAGAYQAYQDYQNKKKKETKKKNKKKATKKATPTPSSTAEVSPGVKITEKSQAEMASTPTPSATAKNTEQNAVKPLESQEVSQSIPANSQFPISMKALIVIVGILALITVAICVLLLRKK